MKATARTRGRWQLLALVALFGSTVAAAYILVAIGWHPTSTKNYGELVQPARPLSEVTLIDISGARVANVLRGKWSLVYFGSLQCPPPCTEALYKMRQLEAAQGREAHRVRRVMIVTDAGSATILSGKLKDYVGTTVYVGPAPAVRELALQFTLPVGSPLDGLHRLYVVDPLGNFMMSYPADADLRRINKDIGVLLRTSQVG
jgi:hypothetical protein